MIFVDGCVLESAVGAAGAPRAEAQQYFLRCLDLGIPLATSAAAVLQATTRFEAADRVDRIDRLLELVRGRCVDVWSLEFEDVCHAHRLRGDFPDLDERALVKLAACRRRGVAAIHTYDGMLRYASRLCAGGMRPTAADRARAFQRKWEEERRREREAAVRGGTHVP